MPSTIAIDGPSGAGKSAVAERLAAHLGYRYIDTGAMYRTVALASQRRQLAPDDADAIGALAETVAIEILPNGPADGRQYTVVLDGEDVTWQIRTPAVEQAVSRIAAQPRVREALVAQQRAMAADGRVVMVGRDIGTVVLPDADLKVYLTATPETRARRRMAQFAANGIDADYRTVLEEIVRRDAQDSARAHSPLRPARDAIIIPNDGPLDETVHAVLALCKEAPRHRHD